MPKAPCNDTCRNACAPNKGCAFNLLCICCPDDLIDPCIENNTAAQSSPAMSLDAITDGLDRIATSGDLDNEHSTIVAEAAKALRVGTKQQKLLAFLLHDPIAVDARDSLAHALKLWRSRQAE
jgi:hypothetical protein